MNRLKHFRRHTRQSRDVVEHVRIGGICQGAMTLLGRDTLAYFLDLLAKPDFLEIVVVVPQIAEVVGTHTAGPNRPVSVYLGADPASVTVDHLVLFLQNALNKLVVFDPEGFRNLLST